MRAATGRPAPSEAWGSRTARPARARGTDPVAMRYVRINETDDNPDYIELYRPSPPSSRSRAPAESAGLVSARERGPEPAHLKLTAVPELILDRNGAYVVLGDGSAPPPEMPGSATYVDLDAVGGGNIPWVASRVRLRALRQLRPARGHVPLDEAGNVNLAPQSSARAGALVGVLRRCSAHVRRMSPPSAGTRRDRHQHGSRLPAVRHAHDGLGEHHDRDLDA